MTTKNAQAPFQAVAEPYRSSVVTKHISSKSLRKLVRKAKQHNAKATDRLCRLYFPIVKSIYTTPGVHYLLGEDAISIAWELFLTFILEYRGNNYRQLPGLIKHYLSNRMKNRLRKPSAYKTLVDIDSETLELMPKEEPAFIQDLKNESFFSLLKGCTKQQIKIAELLYIYGLSKRHVAKLLKCNERRIYQQNERIRAIAMKNCKA